MGCIPPANVVDRKLGDAVGVWLCGGVRVGPGSGSVTQRRVLAIAGDLSELVLPVPADALAGPAVWVVASDVRRLVFRKPVRLLRVRRAVDDRGVEDG